MFTGIVEELGKVDKIEVEGSNIHFSIESSLADEAYIDQSISHNGVCLTIVKIDGDKYVVTAIEETLNKTNLGKLEVGNVVNLERAMLPNKRLDGHFVQGHVDTTTLCLDVQVVDGSWYYTFAIPNEYAPMVVPKGSIAINGVSLTVVLDKDFAPDTFKVAIIPYTYEHTNFKNILAGDTVNLEFDIFGKYVARYFDLMKERE